MDECVCAPDVLALCSTCMYLEEWKLEAMGFSRNQNSNMMLYMHGYSPKFVIPKDKM